MKRRWFIVCLCLLLSLFLCACQDGEQPETASFDGGTWTRLEDRTLNMQEYAYQSEDTHIPDDWTLPAGTVGGFTRTEVKGDLLLYGEYQEMVMDQGFTVARYADGTLTPVYTFEAGLTMTWQKFFSPDGTKLVIPWKPQTDLENPSDTAWQLRIVDLSTGREEDLSLPPTERPTGILFAKWLDETTLEVTAAGDDLYENPLQPAWTYALPA